MKLLQSILAMKRPLGSESDTYERFLRPLGVQQDPLSGNYTLRIGESSTLFSCHLDTVEWTGGKQRIEWDQTTQTMRVAGGGILGADDGAGLYLMMQMIEAQIPALYLFHWGEESGGLGSTQLVEQNPELLRGIRQAIAFDRRGTTDLITHQRKQRTASEAYVARLSAALGMGHRAAHGSFTDTYHYKEWVAECTNLSVGYQDEHTEEEWLDCAYLERLLERLLRVDWEELATTVAVSPLEGWSEAA